MLLNCGVGEDLRVPWTARRSNQLILKEISPEYSREGLMLKLKLQYFGHLDRKSTRLNSSHTTVSRMPSSAWKSYQSILKETNPEYSLEGLMLKLKLQYFGHLMQRANLLEKPLMLGKI